MLPRKDHFKYKYTDWIKVIGCKKKKVYYKNNKHKKARGTY